MPNKYLNIQFPFKDSPDGFFLNLNYTDSKAIVSDLMHLLLTNQGERLYNPNFGTNLRKFIFEPNDSKTKGDIKNHIQEVVKRYIPNLVINDVLVEDSELSDHLATVKIDYTITDNVFEESDILIINL
jgi:phage baseplate assembly protein W